MSDQPTSSEPSTDSDGSGTTGARPGALPIIINAQYVKDLSFENPNAPRSLMAGQPAPQVSVSANVEAQALAENVYEVVLMLRAEAKSGENTAFLTELSYGGVFTLQGLAPEHHRPVLLIEGARLLFPFARAILAEATRDGGFPPLMINPIDFLDLYRRRYGVPQETPAASEAGR